MDRDCHVCRTYFFGEANMTDRGISAIGVVVRIRFVDFLRIVLPTRTVQGLFPGGARAPCRTSSLRATE